MNNKFEEARQNALRAVELDPNFGVRLATPRHLFGVTWSRRPSDTYKEALRHLG